MINQIPSSWSESFIGRRARLAAAAVARQLPRIDREKLIARLSRPYVLGNDLGRLTARRSDLPYPKLIDDRTGTDLMVRLMVIQNRVRWQRWLILAARTTWLALLVILVMMLARFFVPVPWLAIGAATLAVVAGAVIYDRLHPITPWTAGRLVDRHWRLHEQVTTALELATTGSSLRLARPQIQAAFKALEQEREHRRLRPRLAWAEMQMALALGLVVAGLTLAVGPSERLVVPRGFLSPEGPSTIELPLGASTTPLDPNGMVNGEYGNMTTSPPTDYDGLTGVDAEALRQMAELSQRSMQELEKIGDALKDASITSQAAQSIQAGDYQRASEQIAELSRQVDQLSPEARRDLAERLKQAAQNVQTLDPELARRLEQASKNLGSRNERDVSRALEDLSKAVSETGQNVISQQQLAEALERMEGAGAEAGGINDEGPGRMNPGASTTPGNEGASLGEGDPGQYGYGSAENAIPGSLNAASGQEGTGAGGSGAGRGTGPDSEAYQPSSNPNAQRAEVPIDTGAGPTANRPGRNNNRQPDIVTTAPGKTDAGQAAQGNLPINTGLDVNRVPRMLQNVIQGYFRNQPPASQGAPTNPPTRNQPK